jgi:hypothetical protein
LRVEFEGAGESFGGVLQPQPDAVGRAERLVGRREVRLERAASSARSTLR